MPFLAVGEVEQFRPGAGRDERGRVRAHRGHLLGGTRPSSPASSTRSRPASATPTSAPARPPAPGPGRRRSAAGRASGSTGKGGCGPYYVAAVHAGAEPHGHRRVSGPFPNIDSSCLATTRRSSCLRPGPKAQEVVRRDEAVDLSPATSRNIRWSSRGARAPWSRTWTATATSTSWPASRCPPPATAIRRWSPRSRTRPTASSTSAARTSTTRGWPRCASGWAAVAPGPSKKRVFLTNSGTEAIEGAIKLARYATRRTAIIAFHGAFHGRSTGAISLTSSKARQHAGFGPLLPDVHHVPFANRYRCQSCGDTPDVPRRVYASTSSRGPVRPPARPPRRRRHLRRADPGRGRLRRPAPRLPSRPAGALRPLRHPARGRRGAERRRPHRQDVGLRARRRRARHPAAPPRASAPACRSGRSSRRSRSARGRADRTAPPSAGIRCAAPRRSPRSTWSRAADGERDAHGRAPAWPAPAAGRAAVRLHRRRPRAWD